jgi:pantoate--beta-alanine ligase
VELTGSADAFAKQLSAARHAGRRVGLVPTMGALHEGHLSLMHAARLENDLVAATIFVNPLQFGPSEDFSTYPRDIEGDQAAAEEAGVDCLFAPTTDELFPDGPPVTTVDVPSLSSVLEGASRPGHFAGVATIVTKLLSLAGRCAAYFGEKDYQQLVVVRQLVADLSLAARVVGCPIVRDGDGLALSSRNRRLSPEARAAAPVLFAALTAGRSAIGAGERDPVAVEAVMAEVLAAQPLADIDYVVLRDAATLAPRRVVDGDVRLLVAARLGAVRLIDNVGAAPGAPAEG